MPLAWRQVVVGQSFITGTPWAALLIKNGVDHLVLSRGAARNLHVVTGPRPTCSAEVKGSNHL